jgi:DNA-binding YbaB/EbfC family protein
MNMQQIMQQAQRMQREITKKKEEIDNTDFSGKSEWVEIVFNGKREIKSFKILKDGVIDTDDKEMLEDMIMIAIKDAFSKIDKETESKLGNYASMSGLF